MRAVLNKLSYDARAWELGRNRGPRTVGTDGIGEQVVEHGGVVGEGSGPPP